MRLSITLAATTALLATLIPVSRASDITVSLPIDSVTVYRDSAIVTRTGLADIPVGQHRLIVRGLPDGLDPASLQVSARSANLRLGGIEVQRVVEQELVNAAERALNRKLRDIGDQKVALEDEIISAQAQLKLLGGVIEAPTGSGTNAPRLESVALSNLVGTVGSSDAAARQRIRNARLQLRDLDEQAEKLQADLQNVATDHKATTELHALVQADVAGSVPVSVEYQVVNVGWNWQYQARLDTQKKTVALVRQAQLQQGTGEDWKNVDLTISTSKPSLNTTTPPLASLFLSLDAPRYPASAGALEEVVVTGGRRAGYGYNRQSSAPAVNDKAQSAVMSVAEVFNTDFIADYHLPGRVSVAADRQPRLYPIGDERMNVELVARANLAADRVAYLEAKFTYQSDVPIDAGAVQLFRDDAFVGMGALPMVLPGSEVRFPFGQDPRVRIVMHDESEESGNTGVINREQLNQRKRRYEITSFHAVALPIEVIDRIPVPRDNDIKVEILKGATPPALTDLNGQAGVYLWRLAGEPRVTETIRHYYAVKFPRTKVLASVEGS